MEHDMPSYDENSSENSVQVETSPLDTDAGTVAETSADVDDKALETRPEPALDNTHTTEEDVVEERQPAARRKPRVDVPYDQAYRLTVYYSAERGEYGVRCDELGDLGQFAATRAEAFAAGEASIEDKIAQCAVQGQELPKPFGLDVIDDFSGHIDLEISRSMHRELSHTARRERISPARLAAELVAHGLAARAALGQGAPRQASNQRGRHDGRNDGRNDSRNDGRNQVGRGNMNRDRYFELMQDPAVFREYLRSGAAPGGGGVDRGRGRGRQR